MRVSVTLNPFIITIHVGRAKEKAFDYLVGCSCPTCCKARELAMVVDIEREGEAIPPGKNGEPVVCCKCGKAPHEAPTVRLRRPTHEPDYYCNPCWCKHDESER